MKNGHSLPNGLEKNGGNGFKHEMEEKEINEETGEKERRIQKQIGNANYKYNLAII